MKAALLDINNKVNIVNLDIPHVGNNEILVKMKSCGICGSDLEKVFGAYGMKSSRIGHEPAGEIIKIGKNIQNYKKGDRVFVHHHVPCYTCYYCYNDDLTMCEKYQSSNIEPCGLSEYILVPDWNISKGGVIKLPDQINYDQAALIEPVACCLRSLNKLNLKKGSTVTIFGAGPTGLMHLILLRYFGACKIVLVDLNDFRLDFAKKIDPDVEIINAMGKTKEELKKSILLVTSNEGVDGVDVSVISTSSLTAFVQSLEITRKGGTISLFGVPPKGSEASVDLNLVYSKELTIVSSYATSEKEIYQIIELMKTNRINFEKLITHKFYIDDSFEALKYAHNAKDSMKIIITSR